MKNTGSCRKAASSVCIVNVRRRTRRPVIKELLLGSPLSVFPLQQFVWIGFERLTNINQFYVRYKALSAFDSLNRIFIDVEPQKLQPICKLLLRKTENFSFLGKSRPDQIVCPDIRFIDKHSKNLRI